MNEDAPANVEDLLERLARGDEDASAPLLPLLYDELHAIARRQMANQRAGHTLQTTALLNEAWIRLAPEAGDRWQDRRHFVRTAARAMRFVLVDHARKHTAEKRQRQRARPLDENALGHWHDDHAELLALDEALVDLGNRDAEMLRVVELRYFGGLTLEEAGAALGMTIRQVHRRWTFARGWLRRRLGPGPGQGDD